MVIKQFQRVKYNNDEYFITSVGKRVLRGRKIIRSTGQIGTIIHSIPIKDIEKEKKRYLIYNKFSNKEERWPGIMYKNYLILKYLPVAADKASYLVAKDKNILTIVVTQRAAKKYINNL